jgi:hypothetical protein
LEGKIQNQRSEVGSEGGHRVYDMEETSNVREKLQEKVVSEEETNLVAVGNKEEMMIGPAERESGDNKGKGMMVIGLVANLGAETSCPDQTSIPAYGCSKGISPTLVDEKLGLRRPGLGPEKIEDLGIQKEDIGLKDPRVLLDMPSPVPLGWSLSKEISLAQIEKGREAVLKITEGKEVVKLNSERAVDDLDNVKW